MGGGWKSTLDFTKDGNGEEPGPRSADDLAKLVNEHSLVDTWRCENANKKQYTWVKVNKDRISAGRLDFGAEKRPWTFTES